MTTVDELKKKAAELNIDGRSKMNKTQLEKAIADATGGSPAPKKGKGKKSKKAKTPEQLQQERYARTQANREANAAEIAQGQAEAARLAEKYENERRTGPQQALDRAEAEANE